MDDLKTTYLDDDINAEEADYLFIAQSQIAHAGQGLFTAIDIYKDEVIAMYHGEKISREEATLRTKSNNHTYFINLPKGGTFDCRLTPGYAKYANDADGLTKGNRKNNAKIALDENGSICLIALRTIYAMHEICCAYGKNYWRNTLTQKPV